jgi:hypothetical protein
LTTDRYEHARYHVPAEATMSPEFPVMPRTDRQEPSMEDRQIFGEAATHRAVE